MISGVTSTGFVRPTIEEITTYVSDLIKAQATDASGNEPNLTPPEFWGVELGVNVALYNDFIQILERLYYDLFIQTASGIELDRRAYPTIRLQAGFATGTLTFTGGLAGGTISHSVAFEAEDGRQYKLIADLTLDLYGDGSGTALSVVAGSDQNAPIGAVRFIPIPVSGMPLLQVTNSSAMLDGTNIETDAAYRARAILNNSVEKTSSLPAMRAAIEQVANVTAVSGYENLTEVFDVNGVPPGGIVMTVKGGTDLAIATAIYNTKPAGNPSWGDVSQVVVDPTNNVSYTMKFSRVTPVLIYVEATLTKDGTYNATVSDPVVKQSILDYIGGVNPSSVVSEGVAIGETVYGFRAEAACFELNNRNNIPGLLKVVVKLGISSMYVTYDSIAVASNEEAYTDFSIITLL